MVGIHSLIVLSGLMKYFSKPVIIFPLLLNARCLPVITALRRSRVTALKDFFC